MTRSMAMASSTFSSIWFTYSSYLNEHHRLLLTFMFCILFIAFSIFSLGLFSFSMFKRLKRTKEEEEVAVAAVEVPAQNPDSIVMDITDEAHERSLDILSSDRSKWDFFISSLPAHLSIIDSGKIATTQLSDVPKPENYGNDSIAEGLLKTGDQIGKKNKKRAKKKRQNSQGVVDGAGNVVLLFPVLNENDLNSLYPFTSMSSETQRKMKQQYDTVLKASGSRSLTYTQVYDYDEFLKQVDSDLQNEYKNVRWKISVIRTLFHKAIKNAQRSKAHCASSQRLSQEVLKLKAKIKELLEDAQICAEIHYWLRSSPGYKKMIEVGSQMKSKARSDLLVESRDVGFLFTPVEDFIEMEKKDPFWRVDGKWRTFSHSKVAKEQKTKVFSRSKVSGPVRLAD